MSTSFRVGLMVGGSFTPVGTISFDAKGAGKLELVESGEAADRLQAAWDEISAKDRLSVRRSRRVKSESGGTVTELIGVTVARGEAGYPQAVVDALSNDHGMFAQPLR